MTTIDTEILQAKHSLLMRIILDNIDEYAILLKDKTEFIDDKISCLNKVAKKMSSKLKEYMNIYNTLFNEYTRRTKSNDDINAYEQQKILFEEKSFLINQLEDLGSKIDQTEEKNKIKLFKPLISFIDYLQKIHEKNEQEITNALYV